VKLGVKDGEFVATDSSLNLEWHILIKRVDSYKTAVDLYRDSFLPGFDPDNSLIWQPNTHFNDMEPHEFHGMLIGRAAATGFRFEATASSPTDLSDRLTARVPVIPHLEAKGSTDFKAFSELRRPQQFCLLACRCVSSSFQAPRRRIESSTQLLLNSSFGYSRKK
jgi:hypothetical protein